MIKYLSLFFIFLLHNVSLAQFHSDEWGIDVENMDKDRAVFKGQKKSLIDWKKISSESWLDFSDWKARRALRDQDPEWKIKLRDSMHKQLMGILIDCVGKCELFTGVKPSPASHLTKIREGDELHIKTDSAAWLFMVDGTLIRLAANSSLSFLQMTVASKKFTFSLRVNEGHVHVQGRQQGKFQILDAPETDQAFLPLSQPMANREEYARREYQKVDKTKKLAMEAELNLGKNTQYAYLNLLMEKHQKAADWESEYLVVLPNMTLKAVNPILDIFYQINQPALVRAADHLPGFLNLKPRVGDTVTYFRGYTNTEQTQLKYNQWYQVDATGKKMEEVTGQELAIFSYFTKRIPSVHLAREFLIEKYASFLLADEINEKLVGEDFGYRLWKEQEQNERREFLIEYFRRLETTNLNALNKISAPPQSEQDLKRYYEFTMNKTLQNLKSLQSDEQGVVKEMNYLQYYVWVLRKKSGT
jgi:hypothetical protein